jgi:tryptophan synthase alpha chain
MSNLTTEHTKTRITNCFERLAQKNQCALVTFITAGDPDIDISTEILNKLPSAGADIIELGMPFSDPMADGPEIQKSSIRAKKAGISMNRIFGMVATFRKSDQVTPVILMGYFNPIMQYGISQFVKDAKRSGVDGVLCIDLPPEEDIELRTLTKINQFDQIRLIAPASSLYRQKMIISEATGFIYYISIKGVTGTKTPEIEELSTKLKAIKALSKVPVAVGFGVNSTIIARELTKSADAVVVGSSIVKVIREGLESDIVDRKLLIDSVIERVHEFSIAIKGEYSEF